MSDFLAVVLLQAVVLQRLFALVVQAVVAKDGGQVGVLWPDGGGQGVEGKFGLLTILLQGLADGERGLFDHQPALVAWCWFHLSLFCQCEQIYTNTNIWIHNSVIGDSIRLYSHTVSVRSVCNPDIYSQGSIQDFPHHFYLNLHKRKTERKKEMLFNLPLTPSSVLCRRNQRNRRKRVIPDILDVDCKHTSAFWGFYTGGHGMRREGGRECEDVNVL